MTNTKQTAFDLFEAERREFLDYARWHAVRVARQNNGYVNIDLVRDEVGEPSFDNRAFGAVFNAPYFEATGYTQTTRKTSHGRPIRVFRLIEEKLPDKWKRRIADNGNIFLFEEGR